MSTGSLTLPPAGASSTTSRTAAHGLSRGYFFAGLLLVGLASAGTDRLVSSVVSRGFWESVANTFDISAIAWGAAWAGLSLLSRDRSEPIRNLDWLVAAVASLLFLIPFTAFSWLALSSLAIYVIASSPARSMSSRGAWIFLAIAVSLFWSPKLFEAFSPTVLAIDATFVSWITGTERVGNTVRMAEGPGFIWVAPGCSSMANMSLAFLCWMTFGKVFGGTITLRGIAWCVLATGAVVTLNVTRIAIIALKPELYDLVHGPVGTLVASYLTLFAVVGVCFAWKKNEILSGV